MKAGRCLLRYYPIAFSLRGERALVVGGGAVAARKVYGLLKAGARVRVVSPAAGAALRRLAAAGRIRWARRRVRSRDVGPARIVIAATDDERVNGKVSAWSKQEGRPVNVVDNKALSDFISPAVFSWKGAISAIYTDGKDPALSRDLKNFLKENRDGFLRYRHRSQKRDIRGA